MPHALLEEAKRQAEFLANFRIDRIGCRYVVMRILRNGKERKERTLPDHEAAIEYLFNKLPAIESEL